MPDPADKSHIGELVVRDADGRFKVLKDGKLEDWDASPPSRDDRIKRMDRERTPAPVGAPVMPPRATLAPAALPVRPPAPSAAVSIPKPVARYYVDVTDEEEVDGYRQTGDKDRIEKIHELASKKADEILKVSGLAVDAEVQPRLARVIISRLKDIRDLMETKDVLLRPRDLGGVNMDNASANTLLQLIEERRPAFEDEVRGVKASPLRNGLHLTPPIHTPDQPAAGTPAAPGVTLKDKEKTIVTGVVVPSKPIPAPPPLIVKEPRPFIHPSYKAQESGGKKLEARTPPAPPSPPPPPQPPKTPVAELRPTVTDVRTLRRVMGPLDELKTMTIEDFRRLGATVPMIAAKVVEKIELLADESLLKRNEGLVAWKSSPLHQLYLAVGAESLEKSMDVAHVIEEHTKKNHQVFTKEEFDAIADINRKLAY